jgi:hypothetical protein
MPVPLFLSAMIQFSEPPFIILSLKGIFFKLIANNGSRKKV